MSLTHTSAVAWAQPTAGNDPAAQPADTKLSAMAWSARHG
jgi:hypothetical protein